MNKLERIQQEVAGMDEELVLCKIADQRRRMRAINAILEEEELVHEIYRLRLEYLDFINPNNCIKRAKSLEQNS